MINKKLFKWIAIILTLLIINWKSSVWSAQKKGKETKILFEDERAVNDPARYRLAFGLAESRFKNESEVTPKLFKK